MREIFIVTRGNSYETIYNTLKWAKLWCRAFNRGNDWEQYYINIHTVYTAWERVVQKDNKWSERLTLSRVW